MTARPRSAPPARGRRANAARSPVARSVNLALQGGGSHGAFTWGVLDALLEDGRLAFEAITGASAGAVNAVVLAAGWQGGAGADPRGAARRALAEFWHDVGATPNLFARPGAALTPPGWTNPWQLWFDLLTRVWTPAQINPLGINPLRALLLRHVDFARLRAAPPMKLFVSATDVRTGRARIFREYELDEAMVLASTALPFSVAPVEVAGNAYWDGGYMGNPALYPLFYATRTRDIVLVQINPLVRDALPATAQEIVERVSEISFNASLLHELRAIAFVQRLLAEQRVAASDYKKIHLHVVEREADLRAFGAASKSNTAPAFLHRLFTLGRAAGRDWLEASFEYVNHASSVPIAGRFL